MCPVSHALESSSCVLKWRTAVEKIIRLEHEQSKLRPILSILFSTHRYLLVREVSCSEEARAN